MGKVFVVSDMKAEAAKCQGYEERTKADLKIMHEKLFQPLIDLCVIWGHLELRPEIVAGQHWIRCMMHEYGKYDHELCVMFKKKRILEIWYEYKGEYGYCDKYLDEYDYAIQGAILLIEERIEQKIKEKNEKADMNIANYELNKDKQFEFTK
ncbi:hypothetical protein LCGC14_2945380 [marine sediment metagenome]|uniref:Uncharacterized protein n=1 Tax=marine sediment metagenome TaxID=412755 RepID=A0A0F9A7Z0_9ZZZZ